MIQASCITLFIVSEKPLGLIIQLSCLNASLGLYCVPSRPCHHIESIYRLIELYRNYFDVGVSSRNGELGMLSGEVPAMVRQFPHKVYPLWAPSSNPTSMYDVWHGPVEFPSSSITQREHNIGLVKATKSTHSKLL